MGCYQTYFKLLYCVTSPHLSSFMIYIYFALDLLLDFLVVNLFVSV